MNQANALKHDKPTRKMIKGSRWMLLRNAKNLKPEQTVRLQELLATNQPLAAVYVLKDALKEIRYAPSVRVSGKVGGASETGGAMPGPQEP